MPPVCPTCQASVRPANLDPASSSAYCPRCEAHFSVALPPRPAVEQRLPAPLGSSVTITADKNSLRLTIAPRDTQGFGAIVLFGLIWTGITLAAAISYAGAGEWPYLIGLVPLGAIGPIFIGWALKQRHGEFTLECDRWTCRDRWRVGSWSWMHSRPTPAITGVIEAIDHENPDSDKVGYCVGIQSSHRALRFGARLSDAERHWIITELRAFLRGLNTQSTTAKPAPGER